MIDKNKTYNLIYNGDEYKIEYDNTKESWYVIYKYKYYNCICRFNNEEEMFKYYNFLKVFFNDLQFKKQLKEILYES